MTEALHFPATTWHQPGVIGWPMLGGSKAWRDGFATVRAGAAFVLALWLAYNASNV